MSTPYPLCCISSLGKRHVANTDVFLMRVFSCFSFCLVALKSLSSFCASAISFTVRAGGRTYSNVEILYEPTKKYKFFSRQNRDILKVSFKKWPESNCRVCQSRVLGFVVGKVIGFCWVFCCMFSLLTHVIVHSNRYCVLLLFIKCQFWDRS